MMRIRVLIVDDSVVVRKLLSEALSASSEVEVAGTASSGILALSKIPQLNPGLVTLDIEMPGLNGIQTLVEIRRLYPKLPVIMFSTLTERGAAVTLEALSLGASDYVTKPTNSDSLSSSMEQVRQELVRKIVALARLPEASPAIATPLVAKGKSDSTRIDILAIGTSTGGPNALAEVIPRLPAEFPVPVVVVQHMPPLFTRLLAERLDARCPLSVHEGEPGKTLVPGQVWIARGDYHMAVMRKGVDIVLALNQQPPENSCRPAVDVLFRSVAQTYGPNVLGVVMTGMGSDGARGACHIREAGGSVLVQDQATSVVWGMPGAVVSAGAAEGVYSLPDLSHEILRRVTGRRSSPPDVERVWTQPSNSKGISFGR
jgi:two-component system, chemotaxis family, protein-glutamate methylesterase/glutaminase